jgi:hypothetical protein
MCHDKIDSIKNIYDPVVAWQLLVPSGPWKIMQLIAILIAS